MNADCFWQKIAYAFTATLFIQKTFIESTANDRRLPEASSITSTKRKMRNLV